MFIKTLNVHCHLKQVSFIYSWPATTTFSRRDSNLELGSLSTQGMPLSHKSLSNKDQSKVSSFLAEQRLGSLLDLENETNLPD